MRLLLYCNSIFVIVLISVNNVRVTQCRPYDPTDKEIAMIIPPEGTFEAFYPREMYGIPNGDARAPHAHGSFYKHRHPALIDTKNAAAFGYRFDGKRRFNFD